ncbi:MAG: spore germination protein GerW family protein [Dehalococcoidia bacterium]|nr:spore germination protein GerW family protein [Dehalococcoidia bacterium]
MTLSLLQGSPRGVGEKTLIPIAVIAHFQVGSRLEFFGALPVAVREKGPNGERLMHLLPIPGAERRPRMQTADMLKELAERLKSSASVDTVFGDTRETQGKAIIPVASIHYAFGAGGGEGSSPSHDEDLKTSSGSGGGGGGKVRVRPVAVLEVTPEDTRVLPVTDYTRLASICMGGMFFWWIFRSFRRRHK